MKEFIWGAASASYQIEGAFDQDGRGLSIWDDFSHKENNVANGDTGDIACDSYHRAKEDVAIMAEMGLKAYRFSIAWPRIFPNGEGEINPLGFKYYDELVQLLLENGIEPYVTLYHWDLPLALEQKGGWGSRDTAVAFAGYAAVVAKHFDGKVKNYFTLNEPQCSVLLGLATGVHAPGKKLPKEQLILAMHNLALAHGMGVLAVRENSSQKVNVGIVSTGNLCYPQNNTEKNIAAAYKASFDISLQDESSFFSHSWILDPIFFGKYQDFAPFKTFESSVPKEDFEIISQPIDILGVNVYNGKEVDENGAFVERYTGFPRTSLKWPVTPEVMRHGIANIYKRYKTPILITENGMADTDVISLDGKVHDPARIDFLARYLKQLKLGINDGVDCRGYFQWSIMDNFEWHSGYDERFGLVYIDFRTGERILKDSAVWYKEYITKGE